MSTSTVTVSEFRDNLSKYVDLMVKRKREVKLVDGRKGKIIANLVHKKKKEFDWDAHMKFMKDFKPFWTAEDTKHLEKARKASRERLKRLNW